MTRDKVTAKKKPIRTTKVVISHKDPDLAIDMGWSPATAEKFAEFGEYFTIELRVDARGKIRQARFLKV